jgi:glyoxylase-like metal-dependent hydrolase (beta-lactamase superfamily II)
MSTTILHRLAIYALTSASVCAVPAIAGEEIFTHNLGDGISLTTLSERQGVIGRDILIGATDDMLKAYPDGKVPNAINAFLFRANGTNILIDTGLGIRLLDNLKAAGTAPSAVHAILITHMHGDHIGGLLGKDGAAVFPNAAVFIARPEIDYWRTKNDSAKNIERAYKGRLHFFTPRPPEEGLGGDAIVPFVTPVAAYGHTPGHTLYLIDSPKGQVLVWGDLTHATPVQCAYPEVAVTYDVDPAQAVQTRKAVLDFVKRRNLAVAGMHIAAPGFIPPPRGWRPASE